MYQTEIALSSPLCFNFIRPAGHLRLTESCNGILDLMAPRFRVDELFDKIAKSFCSWFDPSNLLLLESQGSYAFASAYGRNLISLLKCFNWGCIWGGENVAEGVGKQAECIPSCPQTTLQPFLVVSWCYVSTHLHDRFSTRLWRSAHPEIYACLLPFC